MTVQFIATGVSMNLVYEVLMQLNPSERREFSQMVHSPYFNAPVRAATLADYLLTCIKEERTPDVLHMQALVSVGGKTSDKQLLNISLSTLLSVLESYLIQKTRDQDPERQLLALSGAYRKRGLQRHFRIVHKEARKNLEAQPRRDSAYLENRFLWEWEQYQFEVSEQRSTILNLQDSSDALDLAFMANKLKMACLALSHQAVYKTAYSLDFLGVILEKLDADSGLLELPALGLYYHCYKFLSEPDGEAYFYAFQEKLERSTKQFPEAELRLLYLLAINYGIKRVNRSEKQALETTLNLYKGALQHDLLLEHGSISRFAFSNIVAIALRTGQTDWVADFIETYKSKIERQWREATASLCLARLAYQRKQFDQALMYLQRADYKDTMNNLSAKVLQMKIYYETDAIDSLESHLKNLKNYIRRHAAIGYHRDNYSNIVRYTEQLLTLNPLDKAARLALREAILKEQVLTEKEWFLEQC